MINAKLTKALTSKTEFTEKEYYSFGSTKNAHDGIGNLRYDDYIKSGSGDSYYRPTVYSTKESVQFLEDLKSISIKEVRLLISKLIEQGLDREVPNRLSDQQLYVTMSSTVQHMPLILQLHESTSSISTNFQTLSETLSLQVEELYGEMLNLVNTLLVGEEKLNGRKPRRHMLNGM